MWMMVLNIISIRKDLGPLVSVFARMGTDMLTFGTIWIILLLGFSCAMHGTGINNDRPECRLPPAGASILGLFCLYTRSLLPLYWVSFASIVGLFCLYSRSLLPLY
jgi:hypothetical protein